MSVCRHCWSFRSFTHLANFDNGLIKNCQMYFQIGWQQFDIECKIHYWLIHGKELIAKDVSSFSANCAGVRRQSTRTFSGTSWAFLSRRELVRLERVSKLSISSCRGANWILVVCWKIRRSSFWSFSQISHWAGNKLTLKRIRINRFRVSLKRVYYN